MSTTPCGCGSAPNDPNAPDESMYMMVKGTSKDASKCGDIDDQISSADAACNKDDPTYDVLLASFAMPDEDSVPAIVCDGSLYSVGQWIQFVTAKATLQVVAINNNELTLKAVCSNGSRINGNPTVGTVIRKSDSIITVGAPECLTSAQELDRIFERLAEAEEFCLPALSEQDNSTANMQVVGWTKEDSGNSGFKKCIRRLASFFFKNNHPYFTALDTVDLSSSSSYRPMVIHKTTKRVVQQKNLSEETAIEAGKKYVYGVVGGSQALIEGYTFSPIDGQEIYKHGGEFDSPDDWVHVPIATPLEANLSLSIGSVNALEILGDYFYAVLRINVGVHNPSAFQISAATRLNNKIVGYTHGFYNTKGSNTITLIAKIDKSSKSIPLKITTDGNGNNLKVHCSVYLDGVFI